MRVIIGVPSGHMVHSDFAWSVMNLAVYTQAVMPHVQTAVVNVKGSLIQKSRTEIEIQALKLKADALLWLDSDMTFPPDTLERLLKHGRAVVGCDYARRSPPFDRVGTGPRGPGLRRVKTLGFGVLLVRASEITGKPFKVRHDGNKWISEDESWCSQREVWCDFDLSSEIRHIGMAGYCLQEDSSTC